MGYMSRVELAEKLINKVSGTSKAAPLIASCPLCPRMDYKFSFTAEELKRHYELVHECHVCGERFPIEEDSDEARALTESQRAQHLADAHGLTFESPGISVEEILPRLVDIPGWLSPAKSLKSVPRDLVRRRAWLLPICERIVVAEDQMEALRDVPARYRARADYVRLNFELVRRAKAVKRYQRLRGATAKARFLAKVLADPDRSPSYAEQLA